jgi:hypothetical protein
MSMALKDDLPNQDSDWCQTVYGKVEELLPREVPKPLGKMITTVTYKDANLYHDMLTGRSVTDILHLCNGTLAEWYSRRQATVETATFGSEFTAARIAVDQIIDLRTSLRQNVYLSITRVIFLEIIRLLFQTVQYHTHH